LPDVEEVDYLFSEPELGRRTAILDYLDGVAPNGELTLRAGEIIMLANGFSVEAGAVFTAEIDSSLGGN